MADLKEGKLCRVFLGDLPVVLFRGSDNCARAYEDRCPHRGAMLSAGRLINGDLECPYHGWRFGEDGGNTFVPVNDGSVNCHLQQVSVAERFELIWLSSAPEATIPELKTGKPHLVLSGEINAKPENILENFLEGSHTHYVHNGWVRSQNKVRQKIQALLQPGPVGFTVQYQQEPAKGLLSRIIPRRHRNLRAVSEYIYPYIAVLEYFDNEGNSVFRVEMVLAPGKENTGYHARVFVGLGLLSGVAASVVKPFLRKVILQDVRILEQQQKNLAATATTNFYSDETDLVGKQIFAWLFNQKHITQVPVEFTVWW
jgi:phenylpropionate dioxygenase-like ring-hydroxylating dioxygenase large terminal subunit